MTGVEMRVQIEFLEHGTAVTDHEIVYDSTVPMPQVGEVVAVPGGNTYRVTERIFHYLGVKGGAGFPRGEGDAHPRQ